MSWTWKHNTNGHTPSKSDVIIIIRAFSTSYKIYVDTLVLVFSSILLHSTYPSVSVNQLAEHTFKLSDFQTVKKRSGWPLGLSPPLPWSGQVNVKFLGKLPYLGLFCHFIKDKMGQNFSHNRSGQARGGWPPQAVSLTAFSPFFFWRLPLCEQTAFVFHCETSLFDF